MDNIWDEDFEDMEEVPLSNGLAERRQGGKRLFIKVSRTTDALPVDKGEQGGRGGTWAPIHHLYWELEPEDTQATPKRRRRKL